MTSISQRVRVRTMTCLALLVPWTAMGAVPATGPLRVHPTNPRYFTDGSGKAIYLTGSHTWRNVQDSANVPDFTSYLDFLKKYRHNCTRLWVYRGSPEGAALTPTIYARTGPGTALDGGLKYDVSKFNQAFFDQLRARCIAAQDRGIYVQVMLDSSETARSEAPGNINWPVHPYNSANNINGVNGDPDGDKWGYEIFSLQVAALTALNESYAHKVMDTLNDLASSTYCLANPGQEYLVYLPDGGEVKVDLTAAMGQLNVEWIHPVEGTDTRAGPVAGGGKRALKAPFNGEVVAHLWTSVTTEPTRAMERDKQ